MDMSAEIQRALYFCDHTNEIIVNNKSAGLLNNIITSRIILRIL